MNILFFEHIPEKELWKFNRFILFVCNRIPLILVALFLATTSVCASSQTKIGSVEQSKNRVSGTLDKVERSLHRDDRVFLYESVKTGKKSLATLLLDDNTRITLGADTTVKLDEFVYHPESSQGAVSLDSARGLFRFITGLLPSRSYEIKTPVATIGVRGTVFDVWNREDGSTVILLRHGKVVVNNVNGSGQSVTLDSPMEMTTLNSAEGQPTPAILASGYVKATFDSFDRAIGDHDNPGAHSLLEKWMSSAWGFLMALEFKPAEIKPGSSKNRRSNSIESAGSDDTDLTEDAGTSATNNPPTTDSSTNSTNTSTSETSAGPSTNSTTASSSTGKSSNTRTTGSSPDDSSGQRDGGGATKGGGGSTTASASLSAGTSGSQSGGTTTLRPIPKVVAPISVGLSTLTNYATLSSGLGNPKERATEKKSKNESNSAKRQPKKRE